MGSGSDKFLLFLTAGFHGKQNPSGKMPREYRENDQGDHVCSKDQCIEGVQVMLQMLQIIKNNKA